MAAYWDDNWDNEEWLKRQNVATLRSIYVKAKNGDRDITNISAVIEQRLQRDVAGDKYQNVNEFDSLAYVQHMEDNKTNGGDDKYKTHREGFGKVVSERLEEIRARGKSGKNYFTDYWKVRILSMTSSILGNKDKETPEVKQMIAALGKNLAKATKEYAKKKDDKEKISAHDAKIFVQAEQSGAFQTAEEKDAAQKLRSVILERAIASNNKALSSFKDKQDLLTENNSFSKASTDILDKITFAFPKDMPADKQKELTALYKKQLMANARQRAAQKIIVDENTWLQGVSPAGIKKLYQEEADKHLIHSVVLAGLASDTDITEGLLKRIEVDKAGNVLFNNDDGKFDNISDKIEKIKNGAQSIEPLAVNLDTYVLEEETKKFTKDFNLKDIKAEYLGFFNKAKAAVKAVKQEITEKKGWFITKTAANLFIYGGGAALMATTSIPLAITGAAMYATWTWANAHWMPAIDASVKEGYAQKKGFLTNIADAWKNRKQAHAAKMKEHNFANRAKHRTTEGVIVGGIGVVSAALGAGNWLASLTRQGAMAIGKGYALKKSSRAQKEATATFNANRNLQNFKILQTCSSQMNQDKVSLAAVIVGSVAVDAFRHESIAEQLPAQLDDLTSKVNGWTSTITSGASSDAAEQIADADTTIVAEEVNLKQLTDTLTTEQREELLKAQAGINKNDSIASDTLGVEKKIIQNGDADAQNGDAAANAEEVAKFDASKLTGNEKSQYLNSINKWDNNALARRLAELEKAGTNVDANMKQTLEASFADNANGKAVVESFYEAINSGKVQSLPEGVSAVEYVDKLTRLAQLAPIVQRDAIEIMTKDLLCPDYVPSAEEIAKVHTALNTIVYEKGSMDCVIEDANGNPCVRKVSMFGQYTGPQQMVKINIDGVEKDVPLRTANVTTGLGAEVDCAEGKAKIVSTYQTNKIDCGCDKVPEVEPKTPVDAAQADMASDLKGAGLKPTELKINFANPQSELTATYSPTHDNVLVSGDLKGQNVVYMKLNKDGELRLFQDKATLLDDSGNPTGDPVTNNGKGVEVHHDAVVNMEQAVIDKMKLSGITNTEKDLTFNYGKNVSINVDKGTGETHLLIKGKEVVVDAETATRLATHMNKDLSTNMNGITLTTGGELEQNNNSILEVLSEKDKKNFAEALQERGTKLGKRIISSADKVKGTPVITGADSTTPVLTEVTLGEQSETALNQAIDNKGVAFKGVEDGRYVFTVKGVDGLSTVSLPELQHAEVASATTTAAEDGNSWTIAITDNNQNQFTVSCATQDEGLAISIKDKDGKEVFLDAKSQQAFSETIKTQLEGQGQAISSIDLNPYPKGSLGEKLMGIKEPVAVAENAQEIVADNAAQQAAAVPSYYSGRCILSYSITEKGELGEFGIKASTPPDSKDITEVHQAMCRATGNVYNAANQRDALSFINHYLVYHTVEQKLAAGEDVPNGEAFLNNFESRLTKYGLEIGKDGKLHPTEANLAKELRTSNIPVSKGNTGKTGGGR